MNAAWLKKVPYHHFFSGKAYKRSKRLHQLLALVMDILHFNSNQLTLEGECLLEIEDLKMCILPNEIVHWQKFHWGEKFAGIFDKCESYRDRTRNGKTWKSSTVLVYICWDGSAISSIHLKY